MQGILGVLAFSSPFSFLLSFKAVTYFLIMKTDWDQLKPQLITIITKLILDLSKEQNTLYKFEFGISSAQLPEVISPSYDLEISQTWRLWKDAQTRFQSI